jgi:DNA helicase HerA-like ATPase
MSFLPRIEKLPLKKKWIFYGWDKREEEAEYNPNYWPLGRNSETGEKVYLDMRHSRHILVLGSTGSGKTFLNERIICSAYKSGASIAIVTDIKSEYGSLCEPCDERFTQYLMRGEYPEPLPVKSFYPYFLNKYLGAKPKRDILFQLKLTDISYTDLLTILGLEEDEQSQVGDVVKLLAGRIKEKRITTFTQIIDFLTSQDIYAQTQKLLINKFKLLLNYNVFGDQYAYNFVDEINKGNIPVLSLRGFDQVGAEHGWTSSYVSIITRQLRDAKERGVIKNKLLLVYEETPRFVPREGNPSSKKTIEKLVRECRAFGISCLFSSQDLFEVPDLLFSQSNYIFIPHNIDVDDLKIVFKRSGVSYEWSPTYINTLMDTIQSMTYNKKTGEREWMLIDKETKEYIIFFPYAPFAKHASEGELK